MNDSDRIVMPVNLQPGCGRQSKDAKLMLVSRAWSSTTHVKDGR